MSSRFCLLQTLVLVFLCTVLNARILPLHSTVKSLLTRQNIPDACTDTCGTAPEQYQSCTPDTCCNNQFETTLFNCYECIGNALQITDYTEPQQNLDILFVACTSAGSPIDKLTLPGQDPNRNLPTSSASQMAPSSTSSGSSTGASSSSPSVGVSSSPSSSLSSPSVPVPSQSTTVTVSTTPLPSSTPRSPVTGSSISASGSGTASASQVSQTDNTGTRPGNVNLSFIIVLASAVGLLFPVLIL
ncbi:hypothetical protein K435DRAFT_854651 [Dendrothele bispora CBS 962.96]|uniref:Extracellular membrane protein CFEM domain-containing protein n=1 Tax=Dendrothele bispora (strain CBS 962.96) TaxID=1314807 RepID=A0A4S8MDF9_DENBC|nr:hypothetical protein K435DRAFT_854651 [Dendrothele bispora CBS 962.96]